MNLSRPIFAVGVMRALLVLVLLSASCTPIGSNRQEFVDGIYPPDCFRIDILEAYGTPHRTGSATDPGRDGFVAWAIRDIEAESGAKVASWDFYLTPRGWFGLYGDYLFYTKGDVLIQARRRFLD